MTRCSALQVWDAGTTHAWVSVAFKLPWNLAI